MKYTIYCDLRVLASAIWAFLNIEKILPPLLLGGNDIDILNRGNFVRTEIATCAVSCIRSLRSIQVPYFIQHGKIKHDTLPQCQVQVQLFYAPSSI